MDKQLTGILYSKQSSVPFILEDFTVKILPPNFNDEFENNATFKFKKDNNGFIHGLLYNGQKISIWVGTHEIECVTEHHLHIGLYMLSSNKSTVTFQGISISGDTINNIVGNTNIECKEIISYDLNNDGKTLLSIHTTYSERHSHFGREKSVISKITFQFNEERIFDETLYLSIVF